MLLARAALASEKRIGNQWRAKKEKSGPVAVIVAIAVIETVATVLTVVVISVLPVVVRKTQQKMKL